jgi:hypothetical protein
MKSEPVSPALEVPRVHRPAGLVSWVQAYRLYLREEGLYVIHLGRGWMGPEVVPNWLGDKIAKWLRSKIDAKLAVVDREIAGELPEDLLGRGESFLVSIVELGAVTCEIQEGCDPKLLIRSRAKKLTLFGRENAEVAFAQIAHYFER